MFFTRRHRPESNAAKGSGLEVGDAVTEVAIVVVVRRQLVGLGLGVKKSTSPLPEKTTGGPGAGHSSYPRDHTSGNLT